MVANTGSSQPMPPRRSLSTTTSVKNISLDRKPLNSGTPAMEAAAMAASHMVTGM